MDKTSTMTKINGTALLNAFKSRGINHAEIAEQFGYSKSYFSSCARTNTIRTSLAELIWNECNIPLDEYKSKEHAEKLDSEELYETVYRAMVDAINDSQTGIYAACYGAFKKALNEAGR